MREAGLRVTPQRRAVWSVFVDESSGHLTADEVFEVARRDLPELARATVYNALGELVRAGMLQTVEGRGATLYDSNLDTTHHHFRCENCDRLYDVNVDGVDELRILGKGFEIDRKTITFTGICPSCHA